MAKASFDPDARETVIGHGVQVKGNLESDNDIWIDGTVHGSVRSEGSVGLGSNAQIFGNISAVNLEVDGQVKGNLNVRERLILGPSGRVLGDCKTASLVVNDGAALIGQVTTADPEAGREASSHEPTSQS